MNQLSLKACIFDVNGVLIDSNIANARAMAEAFGGDPNRRKSIEEAYLKLTGINRGQKIRVIQEQVIGTPFRNREFDCIWEAFRELAHVSMNRAPLMPGARRTLLELGDRGIVRAALSNTPLGELQDVLAAHQLEGLLEIIRGGGDWPKSKSLAQLLKDYDLNPSSCLFFGDGKGDLAAARSVGVPFVAIDPGMTEFADETGFQGPFRSLEEWRLRLEMWKPAI